jgi:hypothetical protein
MRTTLEIDDDVLLAVKELATGRKTTAGKVMSELARQALTSRVDVERLPVRNGFPVLPSTGKVITVEFIEKLLEEGV